MHDHIQRGQIYSLDDHPVTIQRRLGEGSGKAVFAADIHLPGRGQVEHVALAVNRYPGHDPSFCRESDALAETSIKGAVIPFGPLPFKDDTGTEYMASFSERVKGQNLHYYMAGKGDTMATGEVADCMGQVARTLHSAHSQGKTHLDVKPANIMREADNGKLKVIDWEMTMDTSTTIKDSIGTPVFMAPEMAKGGPVVVDPKMDVYSAGITMEKLANGTISPRFDQNLDLNNPTDILECYRQISESQAMPSTKDPILNQTLKRATNPDPAKRGTALDMMTDLAAFPEARQHYDQDDQDQIVGNLVSRASDHRRRVPLLDAAAARGLLEDIPLEHPNHRSLEAISKLAPAPRQEQQAPPVAKQSQTNQATQQVDMAQFVRGPRR